MAERIITWAALAVLEKTSRAKVPLYPTLWWTDRWSASVPELYYSILVPANEVVYGNRKYSKDCILKCYRNLVAHVTCLLAVYNGRWLGGTAMTVRYTRKLGQETIVLNPLFW